MVTRKWRAPVVQHAHESPLLDVRCKFFFWEECHAQSFKRRNYDMGRGVENRLAIDANIQPTTPALELLDVQPSVRRKAEVDAAVSHQIAG